MNYPALEGKYIIETSHGCYSDSGWCYNSFRIDKAEAVTHAKNLKFEGQYRVVDHLGNIIWDPNNPVHPNKAI